MAKPRTFILLLAVALLATSVTAGAMRRTSATFDEIVLVAGGLRGIEKDAWDMVTSQPPVMLYLYGAAARSTAPTLPREDGHWGPDEGWNYARAVFFQTGNDPERVLGRARWVGALMVGALVLAAGLLAGWAAGQVAATLAAVLVAATPDVLAHGGVAYNDLPLALAFLLALWALDGVVRQPTPLRAALAGGATALALGVKVSALALAPAALVLIGAEAATRARNRRWWADLGLCAVVYGLALWAGLMVLYRGDPTLTLFRLAFWRTVVHAEGGHPAAAYLLGSTSPAGWWYFFPVVFFLKTPAAFQGLIALGGGSLIWRLFQSHKRLPTNRLVWSRILRWRGRAPLVGAVVFGAFLMRSHLDSGFRYALPVLPLLAVSAAIGLAGVWRTGRLGAGGIVVLLALQVASMATAYPHLLAYTSIWAGPRDQAHWVLVDSSLDWGQGLLELRRFMADEGVPRVRLGYFGSAMPEAYGIGYEALPSFFRLEGSVRVGESPRFTVLSATVLHGLYLQGHDPFASYRERTPYRVLGHTMFVYDDAPPSPSTRAR